MLRPGRIDFTVHFDYLDDETIKRLMVKRLKDCTGFETLDLDKIVKTIDGKVQGAIVSEIIKRGLDWQESIKDISVDGSEHLEITQSSLLAAVSSVNDHTNLLRKADTGQNEQATLDKVLTDLLKKVSSEQVDTLKKQIETMIEEI